MVSGLCDVHALAPVTAYFDNAFGCKPCKPCKPYEKAGPQPPIAVEEREGRGRCVVAAMTLPPGTSLPVISGAPPFATCVMPSLRKERCAVCLQAGKRGTALVACKDCGHTHYCSAVCREADAPLHRHQCPHLRSPTSALLALEADAAPGMLGRFGSLLLASRCLWRQRELEEGADGEEGKRVAALFAAMEAPPSSSSGEHTLGDLAEDFDGFLPPGTGAQDVARLLGSFRLNLFHVPDAEHRPAGVGCYPLGALLNHSCAPNCIAALDGTSLRVRTLCEVPAGTELCHSYVELTEPTIERQRHLAAQYGVDCRCRRCVDFGALDGEMVEVAEPFDEADMEALLSARALLKRASERKLED